MKTDFAHLAGVVEFLEGVNKRSTFWVSGAVIKAKTRIGMHRSGVVHLPDHGQQRCHANAAGNEDDVLEVIAQAKVVLRHADGQQIAFLDLLNHAL